jgi:hypothetical protein
VRDSTALADTRQFIARIAQSANAPAAAAAENKK